jgi:hypothetical protein
MVLFFSLRCWVLLRITSAFRAVILVQLSRGTEVSVLVRKTKHVGYL